jgi:hypothetical protein
MRTSELRFRRSRPGRFFGSSKPNRVPKGVRKAPENQSSHACDGGPGHLEGILLRYQRALAIGGRRARSRRRHIRPLIVPTGARRRGFETLLLVRAGMVDAGSRRSLLGATPGAPWMRGRSVCPLAEDEQRCGVHDRDHREDDRGHRAAGSKPATLPLSRTRTRSNGTRAARGSSASRRRLRSAARTPRQRPARRRARNDARQPRPPGRPSVKPFAQGAVA